MLFRATSTAFSVMSNAIHELDFTASRRETISISLSTAIAAHWLMPRMSQFRAKFPGVELVCQLFSGEISGSVYDVDLGMRLANPQEGELHHWPFCDEIIMALCSKEYLERTGPLEGPVGGPSHTLIRLTGQRYTWDDFFNTTGLLPAKNAPTLAFSDYATVLHAAVGGQGVVLGWMTATARLVIDGALVLASPQIVETGRRYHLVASSRKPMRPIVADVRDWLIGEMRNDQEMIASM